MLTLFSQSISIDIPYIYLFTYLSTYVSHFSPVYFSSFLSVFPAVDRSMSLPGVGDSCVFYPSASGRSPGKNQIFLVLVFKIDFLGFSYLEGGTT